MSKSITYVAYTDDRLTAKMIEYSRRLLLESGNIIKTRAENSLVGPRTGRWYTIPGTTICYRASAIGEYPAYRTGALRSSIGMHINMVQSSVTVGSSLDYAKILEERNPISGGRPWLSRAATESYDDIVKLWSKPWTFA